MNCVPPCCSNYPQFAQHKAEHDGFTRRVVELKQGLDKGQIALSVTTMQFLSDWLKNHIMKLDTMIPQHLLQLP